MEAKSKLKQDFGKTSTPLHSNEMYKFQASNEISSIVAVEKKKKLIVLVVEAIENIGHPRKGASFQAIKKWIVNLRGNETNAFNTMLKLSVTKGLSSGELIRPKHCLTAVGATGSFTLPKNDGVKKSANKIVKPSKTKSSPQNEKQTHEKPKGKKVAQVTGKKAPTKSAVKKVTGKKSLTKSTGAKLTGKKASLIPVASKVTGKKASLKPVASKVTGKKASLKPVASKVTGKKALAKSMVAKLTGKKVPAKSAAPIQPNSILSSLESDEDEKVSTAVPENRTVKNASKHISKIANKKKPVAKMDSLETKEKQTSPVNKGESLKKNTKDNTEKGKTFDVDENAKKQQRKKDANMGQSKLHKKETSTTADGKTSKARVMKKLFPPNQRRKDLSDTELDTNINRPIPLKSYSSDTELEISKRKDPNSNKSTKIRERKGQSKKI